MEPISPADRLTRILRQKLLERGKKSAGAVTANSPSGLEVSKAVAASGDPNNWQTRRALVEGILVDQFGDRLVNEPKFQQVVEDVTRALADDGQAADLINQVLRDLRDGA